MSNNRTFNDPSMTVRNYWIDQTTSFLKKDHVVYGITLKCASTFYCSLLQNNGWKPAKFSDIDWENDHVFSFIMDPWKRRAKGIAEDLLNGYSVEQYLLNNLGKKFWEDHLTFGGHSIPITLYWPGYYDKIDWIPLDAGVDSNRLLDKLLKSHAMTLDYSNTVETHVTEEYKQEVYEKIKKMVGNGSSTLQLMLSSDVDLYNNVLGRINLQGDSWDKISWLKNKNHN